ncbi:dipeptide epimerase [Anabaena sphaerica FACHB-251]|uniref:Dipeptide epimerase n=1 Tax=Anabaena sphaerica FACHB-251 TaxID=2692883 RepID=A0A926WH31_9NOST|nr:dipeptide epimerase [Anabaena sphaerica]MBD2293654.1 dipeptide epimerase [Anabaena sphaerica FACHB-251]
MKILINLFTVNKRFPLTISRGTTAQTTNIRVKIIENGIEGWGEASPFGVGNHRQTTDIITEALQKIAPVLESFNPWQHQEIEAVLAQFKIPSAAKAALDMALYDWMGKSLGLPVWQLLGLNRNAIAPTSVTIGINSPEGAAARTKDWLKYMDVRLLKVKLGSTEGIEADRKMLLAVRETAPEIDLFVDANGGWSLADAIAMSLWLADLGIQYIEQPLPRGQETHLATLKEHSPLPIFVDESCFISADIPQLADYVDGVNIKLMKSGGLSEALRMVYTAKAHGLKVMFGCYSDSSLANTAASHIAPLADYLDLDSHLNLIDDPFIGASVKQGRVLPNDLPGLGVQYSASAT